MKLFVCFIAFQIFLQKIPVLGFGFSLKNSDVFFFENANFEGKEFI